MRAVSCTADQSIRASSLETVSPYSIPLSVLSSLNGSPTAIGNQRPSFLWP